jgi:hypothetical protein
MILGSSSLTPVAARCCSLSPAWWREEDAAEDCAHTEEERTGVAASEASRQVVKPRWRASTAPGQYGKLNAAALSQAHRRPSSQARAAGERRGRGRATLAPE